MFLYKNFLHKTWLTLKKEKEIIRSLLKGTGIAINGNNAYDPQIHNENFYSRVLREGSLGLGESYMDGWWDCEKLDDSSHNTEKRQVRDINIDHILKDAGLPVLHHKVQSFYNLDNLQNR